MIRKSRLAVLAAVAVLPSLLKRPLYRLFFGYKIGKGVRIGFSIIDANECTIGDGVSKIRPTGQGQQNAFSEGGFTLPKLKLGKIAVRKPDGTLVPGRR